MSDRRSSPFRPLLAVPAPGERPGIPLPRYLAGDRKEDGSSAATSAVPDPM